MNVLTGATSTITNSGTIETVNVMNRTTATITNSDTIGTVNNRGTVGSIYNNNNGIIGTINNSGSVDTIINIGIVGTINNSGIITNVDNKISGITDTITNTKTIGNISTGKSTSTIINNTGTISSMMIGVDSTVNVNNTGIISSVYIGSVGMWYYNTETGAIEDFQSIYTAGNYKDYEYATYTFAANIFGDGSMYYGYDTPITLKLDNFVIPPVWDNSLCNILFAYSSRLQWPTWKYRPFRNG